MTFYNSLKQQMFAEHLLYVRCVRCSFTFKLLHAAPVLKWIEASN